MAQNPNPSFLDASQIIQRSFDGNNDRIRVDAEVSATFGEAEVNVSHIDDSIRLGDGVDLVTTTTVLGDVGLDVNVISGSISGEFTPTGLKVQGKMTTVDITDTASAIPSIALSQRNSLSIANLSTIDTLYIGFSSSVTADSSLGNNAGWEVGPSEGFNIDIQDDIVIYGIAETGKTIRVKIMELA